MRFLVGASERAGRRDSCPPHRPYGP